MESWTDAQIPRAVRRGGRDTLIRAIQELILLCDKPDWSYQRAYVAGQLFQTLATESGLQLLRASPRLSKTTLNKLRELKREMFFIKSSSYSPAAIAKVETVARESAGNE